MAPAARPTDEELGEYADGGLSGRRRAEIEAWLLADPQKALEIERLRRLNDALKGLGEEILEEPVPDRLRDVVRRVEGGTPGDPGGRDGGSPAPGPTTPRGLRGRAWPRFIEAAAVVAVFALGGVIGWSLRPHLDHGRPQVDDMLVDASRAYAFYDGGRNYPIEFPPDQTGAFDAIAARLFEQAVAPPDLATVGYRYLGARLAPAADIRNTLFLFEGEDGRRITVLFWPLAEALAIGSGSLAMDGVLTRFWLQGGFGFAVIGEEANARLEEISDAVAAHYLGLLFVGPG
jgi:anti-sigma factor RsiW